MTVIEDSITQLLKTNPGLIIIKFEADWCGPCKKIAPQVDKWFQNTPPNIMKVVIDVDESLDFYSFFKKKRLLNGIPAILMYKKGNNDPKLADDMVNTSEHAAVEAFFQRCLATYQTL
jgi:thioredoxin 1